MRTVFVLAWTLLSGSALADTVRHPQRAGTPLGNVGTDRGPVSR